MRIRTGACVGGRGLHEGEGALISTARVVPSVKKRMLTRRLGSSRSLSVRARRRSLSRVTQPQHNDFLVKLVQRSIHSKVLHVCFLHLANAKSKAGSTAGGGGLPAVKKAKGLKAALNGAALDKNDEGAKFCTQSSLKGLFNIVGPLRALMQVDVVLQFTCTRIHGLAQIAATEGPETARLAAETVCYALATKWKARQTLSADHGILNLCVLLRSRAMQVSFCGAAAISLFLRDQQGRGLVCSADASECFYALVDLADWAMRFLDESSQDTADLQLKFKQMRQENIVPTMLEHVAIALWGACAVMQRDGELKRLENIRWLQIITRLSQWDDPRCDDCVANAGSGVMALASAELAETILEKDPALLRVMLDITETSRQIQVTACRKVLPSAALFVARCWLLWLSQFALTTRKKGGGAIHCASLAAQLSMAS